MSHPFRFSAQMKPWCSPFLSWRRCWRNAGRCNAQSTWLNVGDLKKQSQNGDYGNMMGILWKRWWWWWLMMMMIVVIIVIVIVIITIIIIIINIIIIAIIVFIYNNNKYYYIQQYIYIYKQYASTTSGYNGVSDHPPLFETYQTDTSQVFTQVDGVRNHDFLQFFLP